MIDVAPPRVHGGSTRSGAKQSARSVGDQIGGIGNIDSLVQDALLNPLYNFFSAVLSRPPGGSNHGAVKNKLKPKPKTKLKPKAKSKRGFTTLTIVDENGRPLTSRQLNALTRRLES